ncbi:MAG: tetratricopeptide repeat protein [Phycisphaerae bacterium]
MSDNLQWSEARERVAGKWQIPALALAGIALGAAILTYQSPVSKIPFYELRDKLASLVDDGLYTAAIQSAGMLLEVPEKSAADLAPVHVALARARLLRAERSGAKVPSIARAVIEHYEQAAVGGVELTSQDHALTGKAYDWIGTYDRAVEHYRAAVKLSSASTESEGPDPDLLKRIIELRADRLGAPAESVHEGLDELLERVRPQGDERSARPDIVLWAVRRKVYLLSDANQVQEAEALVEEASKWFGDGTVISGFSGEKWRQWFEYLRTYVLYRSGAYDETETRLRHLRGRLAQHGDLYAQTGWLLGRVVLGAGGPERPAEAISFFRDVLSQGHAPSAASAATGPGMDEALGVYVAASELGIAEGLVLLERFDEALDRYGNVRRRMRRLPASRHLNPKVIESSLTVVSERLRLEGRLEAALQFAREAAAVGDAMLLEFPQRRMMLLERYSDLQAAVARKKRAEADRLENPRIRISGLGGNDVAMVQGAERTSASAPAQRLRIRRLRDEARTLLLQSAEISGRIAELAVADEDRAAAAAWREAERTQESGDLNAIIAAMKQFMRARPASSFVARALRYLGQAQQSAELFADAVETYRENLQRFRRTPDAAASMIPLARCYIEMGEGHADMAEKTLRLVLEDSDLFTPKAPEYADALFLLSDVLVGRGAYEEAVPVLEEAMVRYPHGERTARARFLLADSYRKSGLALKEDYQEATFAAERERILAEQKNRLRKAAELFAKTVEEFEAKPREDKPPVAPEMSPLDQVYLRHARLYQADCHFELGEYDRALAHYERSAWIHKGTTTALGAYVQIINCHVFMGEGPDAAAAVRRALYVVETMVDEAFADGIGLESRDRWREYFEWVQKSKLF